MMRGRSALALLVIATALLQGGACDGPTSDTVAHNDDEQRIPKVSSFSAGINRQQSRFQKMLHDAKDLGFIVKTRFVEEWLGPYKADIMDSYALFTYRLARILRGWHGRLVRARQLARKHRAQVYSWASELQSRVPVLEEQVDTEVMVIAVLALECLVAGWLLVQVLRLLYR